MFRRVTSVASVTAAATATRSCTITTTNTGHFGNMTPKFDWHAEVTNKHIPKAAFNPYAPGFMESLEKKSLAAQPHASTVDNQFKYMQHTGSYIAASF